MYKAKPIVVKKVSTKMHPEFERFVEATMAEHRTYSSRSVAVHHGSVAVPGVRTVGPSISFFSFESPPEDADLFARTLATLLPRYTQFSDFVVVHFRTASSSSREYFLAECARSAGGGCIEARRNDHEATFQIFRDPSGSFGFIDHDAFAI